MRELESQKICLEFKENEGKLNMFYVEKWKSTGKQKCQHERKNISETKRTKQTLQKYNGNK